MRRYREQPSMVHVITTCFALYYVAIFASGWLKCLANSELRDSSYFWPTSFALAIIFTGIVAFLMRELLRQFRLYRQLKKT